MGFATLYGERKTYSLIKESDENNTIEPKPSPTRVMALLENIEFNFQQHHPKPKASAIWIAGITLATLLAE